MVEREEGEKQGRRASKPLKLRSMTSANFPAAIAKAKASIPPLYDKNKVKSALPMGKDYDAAAEIRNKRLEEET
ncbi:MAG: hypothetical protein VZQ81_07025 [Succiniclasticum sp.]|nr:hypothetical protein [Succiniclasticum sp.]MEE3479757.1 hypothetical protein [Succiniclasticum sp.]